MSNHSFIVGSQAFFTKYEDFQPKDIDILELVDSPDGFKNVMQIHLNGKCIFRWRTMTPEEFIEITISSGLGMNIGKFLVPEFCEKIGFTIDHLKQLEPMLYKLDKKHFYEKTIYNFYVENNGFFLTDDQLDKVYDVYKQSRQQSVIEPEPINEETE